MAPEVIACDKDETANYDEKVCILFFFFFFLPSFFLVRF